jgi:hypothetical protein
VPRYPLDPTCSASEFVRTAIQALCFFGIVVNPVSIGHFTSLGSPQNGHVTPCGVSFALLNGPETVNVFLHFVQVMIFSMICSFAAFWHAVLAFLLACRAFFAAQRQTRSVVFSYPSVPR